MKWLCAGCLLAALTGTLYVVFGHHSSFGGYSANNGLVSTLPTSFQSIPAEQGMWRRKSAVQSNAKRCKQLFKQLSAPGCTHCTDLHTQGDFKFCVRYLMLHHHPPRHSAFIIGNALSTRHGWEPSPSSNWGGSALLP